MSPQPKLTLSADEVAALLGLSRAKVYDAIRTGEIPSIRFGRRVLVPRASLYALVGAEPPPLSSDPSSAASSSSAAGTAWA